MSSTTIVLTPDERRVLEAVVRSRRSRVDYARRARVILGLAAGLSYRALTRQVGWSSATTAKWKARFLADRLDGLRSQHLGSRPSVLTPRLEARIVKWTIQHAPPDGSTHWSTRKLGRVLGVQHTVIARAWQHAGLKPQRLDRYVRSTDPDFEEKAADIIGLYVAPPQHAAVFCLDEKTGIQALDRRDPVLPLSPGRAERHGFEYLRHGTLALYAALNTQTGAVLGQTAPSHTSDEFIRFLGTLVASQSPRRHLHLIIDNFSAHKTTKVAAFLAAHRRVHLHFTPTYSSWLNQVELWFAKIERDVIARGVFASVPDLRRKLLRYIRHYNRSAKPFRWTYTDPTRRIA
jgi:transposase